MNNILAILSFMLIATLTNGLNIPSTSREELEKPVNLSCTLPLEPFLIEAEIIFEPFIDFFIEQELPDIVKLLLEYKLPILCEVVSKSGEKTTTTTPSSGMFEIIILKNRKME